MTAIPAALAVLLPGVEIHRGITFGDRGYHGSILLDPATWPESDLPEKPSHRVDEGTGRWWFDIICSTTDYSVPVGVAGREKTMAWAQHQWEQKATEILTALAAVRLERIIAATMLYLGAGSARLASRPQPLVDPSGLTAARDALQAAMVALDALGVKR